MRLRLARPGRRLLVESGFDAPHLRALHAVAGPQMLCFTSNLCDCLIGIKTRGGSPAALCGKSRSYLRSYSPPAASQPLPTESINRLPHPRSVLLSFATHHNPETIENRKPRHPAGTAPSTSCSQRNPILRSIHGSIHAPFIRSGPDRVLA